MGDHLKYRITLGLLGILGTIQKDVIRTEGDAAVWMRQTSVLVGGKLDIQELLVDRASGQVIKYLKNGHEAVFEDDALQIEGQEDANVTVPAGTFATRHIHGKSAKGTAIDLWIDPEHIPIDGIAKTLVSHATTIELIEYKNAQR